MPSKLMLRALQEYSSTFQRTLESIPIQWDPKGKKFKFHGSPRNSLWWYFNMIFIITIVGVGSTILILLWQLTFADPDKDNMSILMILIFVALVLLGSFGTGTMIALTLYGQEFVRGWNQLSDLERKLRFILSDRDTRVWHQDLVGLSMIFFVRMFAFYPFLLTCCAMIWNLDPFYVFIQRLILPALPAQEYLMLYTIIANTIRLYLIAICVTEVSRLFPLIFMVFITALRMANYCLLTIKRCSSFFNGMTTLRRNGNAFSISSVITMKFMISTYRQAQLILSLVSQFQEVLTAVLLGVGLVLSGFVNYGTLKLHGILPIMFYSFFPSAAIVIPLAVDLMLPFAHKINDIAIDVLFQWRNDISRQRGGLGFNSQRRIYKRIVASCRPLLVYAGIHGLRFCALRKSTKRIFYGAIVDITVYCLLSLPLELFEGLDFG